MQGWGGGYESLSDEKQSKHAEGQRGRSLGVESLYFHCLAEHRHGEDQTEDLQKHTHTRTEKKNRLIEPHVPKDDCSGSKKSLLYHFVL